jgi:hypothetical protein
LTGGTRIREASVQQAESVLAIAVGTARFLVFSAARYALSLEADCGHSTICVVVDLAVTVVVFAVADLNCWPHAAGADPSGRAGAGKIPRKAFALDGGAGRQPRRIAVIRRRDHAIVDNSVAVVVFAIAHFGRGPHIVAHDLPVHAGAHALPAFPHRAAAGDANPRHTRARVVNHTVAVIVDPIADLRHGAERADRARHIRPLSIADVVPRPLTGLGVAWLAQVGEVLIHAAIAVVILAVT